MSSPLIISVSGLRGEIGASLTPDVAIRYALAYSRIIESSKPFVIGFDGRQSGSMFADAICASLNATGRSVLDAGIVATPTVGILVKTSDAAGGIQISASHNPREFNGLKLFSAEGHVITKSEGEKVLKEYYKLANGDSPISWVDVERIGKRTKIDDTTLAHLQAVLKTVDEELIRSKRFKVFLDSNNASGSLLGRRLLKYLGCDVIVYGDKANGDFQHTPEPTMVNLQTVCHKIVDEQACIGFCQDPDADRLALIDENGRYIGEEYTTAICCKNRLQKAKSMNKTGAYNLVINCATSRMTIDIAKEYDGACYRSAVGEANVVDLMKTYNAIYGGEGNGGPIDPSVGYVRDSFVGMVQVLEMMARNDLPLSKIVDMIHGYAIVKRKESLPQEGFQKVIEILKSAFPTEEIDLQDGIRIDWEDSWVLVRPSNTEPIVRVIAEAQTEQKANKLCDYIEDLIKNR